MLNSLNTECNNFITVNNTPSNKQALILLHGYGTSKEDLVNLVPFFSKLKHTTTFIPNAPFKCDLGIGYQWFKIKIDECDIYFDVFEYKSALTILNNFIIKIYKEYNIPYKNIALFGFSQGAVIALGLALLCEYTFSSVVSHSGFFFNYHNKLDMFNLSIQKNQNILLIHGKKDNVIPFYYAESTVKFFKDNNINFSIFFKENLCHNIDEETILEALKFIQAHYYN